NSMLMFNSLQAYINGIRKLLTTKNNKSSKTNMPKKGKYNQRNDHALQKESEFYSSIRLKQVTGQGETQLDALANRGVQYVEVRILDLIPFCKVGVDLSQLYYLQVFMHYCLMEDSAQ